MKEGPSKHFSSHKINKKVVFVGIKTEEEKKDKLVQQNIVKKGKLRQAQSV